MDFEANDMPAHGRRFPWGCLFGSCLAVLLLMVGGAGLVGFLGYRFVTQQIEAYTSETQRELPVVEWDEQEMAKIEDRLEKFGDQVEDGTATEPLVITQDELNALIAREKEWRGRVYVTIADGLVSAEVSVPTDALPGGKGRFFNGAVTLDAELNDGVLVVFAKEAEVNGEKVPDTWMAEIRGQNLAEDMNKDPDVVQWLQKFERMEFVEDTVVLTPKVSETGDAEAENATSPPTGDSGEQETEDQETAVQGAESQTTESEEEAVAEIGNS